MRVIFATKNLHKLQELNSIAPEWVEVTSLPFDLPDAPEGGETFLENALMKALFYSKFVDDPVVADDSGLVIDTLGGFPGVFSSRFMEGADYRRKMQKILRMLEGEENRDARFVCAAVFVSKDEGLVLSALGEVRGRIAEEIRGSRGFGYDPIFIPEGLDRTFGELGEEVKNELSHRRRAFEKLFKLLEKIKGP